MVAYSRSDLNVSIKTVTGVRSLIGLKLFLQLSLRTDKHRPQIVSTVFFHIPNFHTRILFLGKKNIFATVLLVIFGRILNVHRRESCDLANSSFFQNFVI